MLLHNYINEEVEEEEGKKWKDEKDTEFTRKH